MAKNIIGAVGGAKEKADAAKGGVNPGTVTERNPEVGDMLTRALAKNKEAGNPTFVANPTEKTFEIKKAATEALGGAQEKVEDAKGGVPAADPSALTGKATEVKDSATAALGGAQEKVEAVKGGVPAADPSALTGKVTEVKDTATGALAGVQGKVEDAKGGVPAADSSALTGKATELKETVTGALSGAQGNLPGAPDVHASELTKDGVGLGGAHGDEADG